MKKLRSLTLVVFSFVLAISAMAQSHLNESEKKAQNALRDYFRSQNRAYNIDTKDNSFLFKEGDIVYWVTFSGTSPMLYTIHRKGFRYEKEGTFKAACAYEACNAVNRTHKAVKAVCDGKEVLFYNEVYAKDPEDFNKTLSKNVDAFFGATDTYKKVYDTAFETWKNDSIANNSPIVTNQPIGKSDLTASSVSFASKDMKGNIVVDFDMPLRKSNVSCIVAEVALQATEKGVYKIGMKIYSPDGKIMLSKKGLEYTTTKNFTLPKANRLYGVELDPFGSDADDMWKAGEYKVEIYDCEKGALLMTDAFNIL